MRRRVIMPMILMVMIDCYDCDDCDDVDYGDYGDYGDYDDYPDANYNEDKADEQEYFAKNTDKPRIGFLGHDIYLYNDLTGRENLNFFGRLYNTAGLQDRIAKLIEKAGLSLELDEKVRTYSRGMQQKLAICRCFLIKPEILLLDEPFTGLDSQASKFLIDLLEDNSSAAVIFSSHDIELGYQLASSWVILSRGQIMDSGKTVVPAVNDNNFNNKKDSQRSQNSRSDQTGYSSREFSQHYQQLTGQKLTGQKLTDQQLTDQQLTKQQLTGQKLTEQKSKEQLTGQQHREQQLTDQQLKEKQFNKKQLENQKNTHMPMASRPVSEIKFTQALLVLVKKDLRLEFNTGQLSGTVLLFALIGGTIFSMSFLPGQDNVQTLFPGIYWFTQIFAALLILNRSFLRDTENSCQEAILLAPISRDIFLTARIVFNYLIFLFLAVIISPVLFILFEAFPLTAIHWFPVLVLLVNLGLAANGSLLAALATSTRFSDLLLPVLLLPVLIPLILAAVEGARLFYYPEMDLASLYFWLVFIILYDAVCLLVNFILAPYLLKD